MPTGREARRTWWLTRELSVLLMAWPFMGWARRAQARRETRMVVAGATPLRRQGDACRAAYCALLIAVTV